MAKFTKQQNLPKTKSQELLLLFCKVLVAVKNPEEALSFLSDLLSSQEISMLAKRLEIARLLSDGCTYEEIQTQLRVSFGTVARISGWLSKSGEGFRIVLARIPKEKTQWQEEAEEREKPFSWKQVRKRYAQYFLPELLMEEIIKGAKKKQKERLLKLMNRFEEKSEFLEEMKELLKGKRREQ